MPFLASVLQLPHGSSWCLCSPHSSLSCGYTTRSWALGPWMQGADPGVVWGGGCQGCIQRFPSAVCGSKPPSAVCGWVKVWIFHVEEQYSVFISANNSLHPDIRRPVGSAKEISFKHPPPCFASHPSHHLFSLLSFSVSEVRIWHSNTECQISY